MPTVTTKATCDDDGEVILLPPEMGFGIDVELTLVRTGDALTITPKRVSPRELVQRLREMPGSSTIEVRDEIEIPDRDGM